MNLVEGVAYVDSVNDFVADLGEIGAEHDCAVQAFDADYVADRRHLQSAVEHANRAFERGENVATERAVEILLYAAGRRQIRRAMELGVSEGSYDVVVVVDGDDETGATAAVTGLLDEQQTLGGDPETLKDLFDVTDAELDATAGSLADVVRERVALLDVGK